MSLYPGDWKRFDVLSGQLKIADASGEDVIVNAECGSWVAMCEYDDDNKVSIMAAMPEHLANEMEDGVVKLDGVEEHCSISAKSGMVFIVDRKMDGKLPEWFHVPEHRLNPKIVELCGRPDDSGKEQRDKFIESCFHMGRDHRINMPTLENIGYGAVCEMAKGTLSVDLLYNRMRDVIGVEIARRNIHE